MSQRSVVACTQFTRANTFPAPLDLKNFRQACLLARLIRTQSDCRLHAALLPFVDPLVCCFDEEIMNYCYCLPILNALPNFANSAKKSHSQVRSPVLYTVSLRGFS